MPWYDWSPFPWFPMFPFVFMLICLAVLLFVMVPMMRRHGPWRDREMARRTALDILNERYSMGEIDKAEYDEKRRIIS